MSVHMSKLEFFCNRPTIVALINFGLDTSSVNYVPSNANNATTSLENYSVKKKDDDNGRVRGLLGFGNERVVFHLNMDIDSVTMFLNKEDGSQLATLVQESFLLDLKVLTFVTISLYFPEPPFLSPLWFCYATFLL